jgi:ABC-type Fe3+ transport system substrate-binding protein
MAKLFVAFMVTREAQAVLEKYEWRTSYLVNGTLMAKYVRSNNLKLQDPKVLSTILSEDTALEEEVTKILLR